MNKLNQLPAELCERLELPAQIVPGTGSVTVSGGRRALIEGHRGVIAFTGELVAVSFGRQKLSIAGSGLRLEAMNGSELLVTGRIQTVEWS